jgi:hypothetical protein
MFAYVKSNGPRGGLALGAVGGLVVSLPGGRARVAAACSVRP